MNFKLETLNKKDQKELSEREKKALEMRNLELKKLEKKSSETQSQRDKKSGTSQTQLLKDIMVHIDSSQEDDDQNGKGVVSEVAYGSLFDVEVSMEKDIKIYKDSLNDTAQSLTKKEPEQEEKSDVDDTKDLDNFETILNPLVQDQEKPDDMNVDLEAGNRSKFIPKLNTSSQKQIHRPSMHEKNLDTDKKRLEQKHKMINDLKGLRVTRLSEIGYQIPA